MNNKPVALWYKGVTYHNNPGQKHLYREVSRDGDDNWKTAPVEDGSKVQRWLTNNGYRIVYQKKMRGSGWRWDFTQCWMHERYAGSGEEPGDFHPEGIAQLREYIALAVARNNEPKEDTVEPELPVEDAAAHPDYVESVVDKIANWVGVYFTAREAGWIV